MYTLVAVALAKLKMFCGTEIGSLSSPCHYRIKKSKTSSLMSQNRLHGYGDPKILVVILVVLDASWYINTFKNKDCTKSISILIHVYVGGCVSKLRSTRMYMLRPNLKLLTRFKTGRPNLKRVNPFPSRSTGFKTG